VSAATDPAGTPPARPGAPRWQRTVTCGELRREHVGAQVVLDGWVHARRDHGGIYFLDLRDRYGITQVVLSSEVAASARIGPEYVVAVRGTVAERESGQKNPERPTGEVELVASELEVLSSSPTPPFEVAGGAEAATELRLRWRWLDLRRAPLQRNMAHRSRFVHALRRAFERQGFLDVETPILTKATPEGARDYLVPSRVHPGEFYALPQSPQIFKQILMVAGFDRYYQVARCFRDEDLRADRQPEFTQLDMEMSFVEEEDVFRAWEQALLETFREALGLELQTPFPRLSWQQAMERYGVDKPDLRLGRGRSDPRFALELRDAASWAKGSDFSVFRSTVESGGRVLGLTVPHETPLSRKDIAALEELARSLGAQGLAWWKAGAAGGSGPLARFAAGERAHALMEAMDAREEDLCLFVAAEQAVARRALGGLRSHLGTKLGLVPKGEPGTPPAVYAFLWVTRFPMFEFDPATGHWNAAHHPFTAPADWTLGGESPDLEKLESRAYDLVLNGWELGSGSVRIHRADVQQRVFEILGIAPEEQREKFGFLLEALAHGAPPHAGFALGLDRTVALTLGLDNIREVIAFPKTTSAADLMCGAPSPVAPEQLAEVHVRVVAPPPAARPES
jgi:aspartyl-tRNA synthetase